MTNYSVIALSRQPKNLIYGLRMNFPAASRGVSMYDKFYPNAATLKFTNGDIEELGIFL